MKHCPTTVVNLYIAGDIAVARQVCREYVAKGGCVTVAPCDYVYTNGCESGVVIGFINYPPYAKTAEQIVADALQLGEVLRARLCQSSFTVAHVGGETVTHGRD